MKIEERFQVKALLMKGSYKEKGMQPQGIEVAQGDEYLM